MATIKKYRSGYSNAYGYDSSNFKVLVEKLIALNCKCPIETSMVDWLVLRKIISRLQHVLLIKLYTGYYWR